MPVRIVMAAMTTSRCRSHSNSAEENVMVQALTQGNALCGAIALDFLLSQGLRPLAGTSTLAFAP
jgi:hypothetical protein